jgi:hypothetical protein
MLFGLLLFLATYLLAKELFGTRISQISAVVFVSTPPLVLNSSYLLADVPGSSVAITCVLLVFYLQRIEANHYLVLSCIFAFGSIATVLRFGSFITYGSGIFAASLYFLLVKRFEPNLVKRLFKQLTLQFVSLFSFGWIYFTRVTSMNGNTPYEANSNFAANAGVTPLNGLLDLIELTNPFSTLSVWIGTIFGLIAFGGFIFALGNLRPGSKFRYQTLSVFVAGIFSLSLLVIGVRYVQDNYLVLSAPYWVILAAAGLDFFYQRHLKSYEPNFSRFFKVKVLPVTVALLLICLPAYYFATGYVKDVVVASGVRDAGEEIRKETLNEKCLVLSSYPQSAWYSNCLLGIWIKTTKVNPSPGDAGDDFNKVAKSSIDRFELQKWKEMRSFQDLGEYRKYVVLVTNGKRQPSDESIQEDRVTLLERKFVTERVFYAEINASSISAP